MGRVGRVGAGVVLLALVAAACSGGGSSDGDPDGPGSVEVARVSAPETAQHPLDGLTAAELAVFSEVLTAAGKLAGTEFTHIALDEPDKDAVLAWRPGNALQRRAFAVARNAGRTFEVVVDLAGRTLVSWTEVPGVHPGYVPSDYTRAANAANADPRLAAALERRLLGVNDVTLLTFAGGSANGAAETGRRLARVVPFVRAGSAATLFSRPVEGVYATVDVDTGEVLDVADPETPVRRNPVAPAAAAVRERPPLDAVGFTPGEAGRVEVDGARIAWQGWDLRWRANQRTGIELADVRFGDVESLRRVLYQASLADLFVPYQDPDPAWTFRTLLDSVEFGMGSTMITLEPGRDCPTTATFVDVVLPDSSARAVTRAGALCVFERPTGSPAYRHGSEGSLNTELVLRWIAVVGNYDYIVDVVLRADASMQFHVFAAGIVLQKGSEAVVAENARVTGEDEHGVLVGEGLLAVNHDHYLSFRLDLDVDGTANRLVRQDLVAKAVSDNDGRTDVWALDERVIDSELDARYTPDPRAPARIIVQSSTPDGPVGHYPGYEIDFGDAVAVSHLEATDDPGMRRGGWAVESLWVTPNNRAERFASGLYVPDGTAPAGLPAWTEQDRPLVGEDLVVWFTVGFHHVVRTEDLPNMPAHQGSFGLHPVNAYGTNPYLD